MCSPLNNAKRERGGGGWGERERERGHFRNRMKEGGSDGESEIERLIE